MNKETINSFGYQPTVTGTDTGPFSIPPSTGSLLDQYNSCCPNKLPCGICRLTNQMCPRLDGLQITPTCTYSTSTIAPDCSNKVKS